MLFSLFQIITIVQLLHLPFVYIDLCSLVRNTVHIHCLINITHTYATKQIKGPSSLRQSIVWKKANPKIDLERHYTNGFVGVSKSSFDVGDTTSFTNK